MDPRSAERTLPFARPTPPGGRFDYLIVGAGFAGSVLAERLARRLDMRVLLVERRAHIGGNAYDRYDDHGVLVHPYGPHIFHTNSADVFDYLSQLTQWLPYQHRVLASVDGRLVPMPINLDTINSLYGLQLSSLEMGQWRHRGREARAHPQLGRRDRQQGGPRALQQVLPPQPAPAAVIE